MLLPTRVKLCFGVMVFAVLCVLFNSRFKSWHFSKVTWRFSGDFAELISESKNWRKDFFTQKRRHALTTNLLTEKLCAACSSVWAVNTGQRVMKWWGIWGTVNMVFEKNEIFVVTDENTQMLRYWQPQTKIITNKNHNQKTNERFFFFLCMHFGFHGESDHCFELLFA